jgi:acyl carrier protein
MKEDDIRRQILQILHRFAPEADLDRLEATESLREALDIDSFDFLNLIIAVHERFGVNIPESDYRQVSTLKEMVNYVAKAAPSGTSVDV